MAYKTIQTLLDLHGQILDQEDGYWIKIEAWQVEMTENIPHGIRYALTLHGPSGVRILGYDNAHAPKVKGKKYAGRRIEFDHRHRYEDDVGVPYTFKDANQLLTDFFEEADRALERIKEK